jgi:glyoxylase-like metal-dependent hydrolase (beta-lactamase superfamily II)
MRKLPPALALALLGAYHPPEYHIYALHFATERNIPLHYFVPHADTTRKLDCANIIWVLKPEAASKRVVLFDAGYYRQKFLDQAKPVPYERPSAAIQKLGLTPDDVTDIIISHVHWDHLDGADLFPKAHIWIQKDEYAHYIDAQGKPLARAIDTADAAMLAALRHEERVTLIDGDNKEIIPGITVYTGGRHTYASQYISVQTRAGTVVLASDDAVTYQNLEQHIPIWATFAPGDSMRNLEAQDRMRRIASDPKLIFPGHDPAIFTRFPTPGNGVAQVE